jgi:hypothetical protein
MGGGPSGDKVGGGAARMRGLAASGT